MKLLIMGFTNRKCHTCLFLDCLEQLSRLFFWWFPVTVDLTEEEADEDKTEGSTAAFCLSLPGKTLYLSHLLTQKKFRKRGNKDGALRAFYKLEDEGLGKVMEVAGVKGTQGVSINIWYECDSYYLYLTPAF